MSEHIASYSLITPHQHCRWTRLLNKLDIFFHPSSTIFQTNARCHLALQGIASRCWPLTSSRFPTKWRPPPTPPREHNASLDEACLGVRDDFEVAGLPMEDHIDDQKRFFLKKELNCMIRFWYHVFFYMMNSGFWCQVEQWLWIINLWFFCFSGCLWKRDLFCEWNNPSFDRSSQAATLLIHPETTNVNVRRFSIA